MREQYASPASSHARELRGRLHGRELGEPELADASVEIAGLLLEEAERQKRSEERERAEVLARLMSDADGQVFTTLLADRVYRSRDPDRIVDAARHLLRALGVPRYLPAPARIALTGLLRLGPFAPKLAASGMLKRLRKETEHVVLPAEDPALGSYLEHRSAQGVSINVNHLGEAVLGEVEALRRVQGYVALLSRPDVETISVKVSSIFSQIDLLAWDATLACLIERLRIIYRAALAHRYERDGVSTPKLVTLDMESYRDLGLTLAAFRGALDDPEFTGLCAGVVLQAYLPDSAPLQRELTGWARARVDRGGAPIRLRIVKGANLLAERVEAAARGLAVPIFATKAEVDASFKKMVEFGTAPAQARAVRLGIASHNLFDIGFGMALRAARGVEREVSFELLEGMADHVRRAVSELAGETLVYAPLCEPDSMHTAIAYLLRRLDENTAEQNFLRHSFGLRRGDGAWLDQERQFRAALAARDAVAEQPRSRQDRRRERGCSSEPAASSEEDEFRNEPDTDFSRSGNREWIAEILARWQAQPSFDLPQQLGAEGSAHGPSVNGFDPSRPGVVPYSFRLGSESDVERTLHVASDAARSWGQTTLAQRAGSLRRIAAGLRAQRGELIAAMVLDAGKRVEQADGEVSEAVDFAEYYARNLIELERAHPELELRPSGVILVTPPWNFPLAIPAGGVLAGLMGGNAVILKPALETVLCAARLAQICWAAGVPKAVLQLVVVSDEIGSALIRDARIAQTLLTGATSTAELFHRLRPGIALHAETGGKNAIIVSAVADRDEAIKDVLASAFGHSGQKCSACSLLICEAEVYDAPAFRATLRDAAASLPVGSSWDFGSVVTPLIGEPRDPLRSALTRLDPGESWLLEPSCHPDNPRLWSPGIKLGVAEGSALHTTELFGPLLAVMRADDLDHALRIANATPYGLTAGLHSLDEREQRRWSERMQAGNLYINRPITGAIVRRQPFGGMKASSFGGGAKAGGPNYVLQTTRPRQRAAPPIVCAPAPAAAELAVRVRPHLNELQRERLGVGLCSYAQALRNHFRLDHDPTRLLGERNLFRYRPCASVWMRAAADADEVDVLLALGAAISANVPCALSLHPSFDERSGLSAQLAQYDSRIEEASACVERLRHDPRTAPERLRVIGTPEPALGLACAVAHVHMEVSAVLLTGRVELLRYHREQSLSHRFHRYGNLAPERLLPALRTAPEPL